MKIYRLLSVHVVRQSESPLTLLVNAQGLAATSGWSNARLDNSGDPNPTDAIIELAFEADRPDGIVPQVLTPISATLVNKPNHGADAVVVSSRTNRLTVHASEFITPFVPGLPPHLTTFALGEETPPTTGPRFEEVPTTFIFGEEDPPTTRALGEEGPTLGAFGAEGPTTFRFGEEPFTDPRLDDPLGPQFTTQAFGEEGVGNGGQGSGGGPFGGF